MNIVNKRPHSKDCFMMRSGRFEREGDPWCLDYKNPHVTGDKNGGRRGRTHSWIRVRCLDPKCEALVLVEEWGIWNLMNQKLDWMAGL